jgi:hypothetical protein
VISNFMHTLPCYLIVFLSLFFLQCNKGYQDRFGPFYVSNDSTVVLNGDMGSRVDNQLDKLLDNYPNISLIIMEDCPGSRNDEELFKAARNVRSNQINTHLPDYAKIQSGAVDFYLAGVTRTREQGSKIGVHAWSDGSNSATDYPEDHQEHQLYINFYKDIGFSQQEAEDLYFFIINAASPNNIHWMTEQEINDYNIVNP